MMNITIFITTLITNIASTIFYETPEKINSWVSLEKQEKKIEYVIKDMGILLFGIKASNNKDLFYNYK